MKVKATSETPGRLVDRVRSVCEIMEREIRHGHEPSDLPYWESVLPEWFLSSHAEPETRLPEGASIEEKRQYSRNAPWTLPGWLGWWSDELKNWTLMDAEVDGLATASFELALNDVNGPLGSFRWLVRAAGGEISDEDI